MRFNSIKSHSKETIFDSFEFDNQLCQAASKEIISKIYTKHVKLTVVRESWEKNPKRGIIAERVFRGKIESVALHHFVYVPMFWNFFPQSALGDGPKNGIYFCSARRISAHIGICHLKFTLQ